MGRGVASTLVVTAGAVVGAGVSGTPSTVDGSIEIIWSYYYFAWVYGEEIKGQEIVHSHEIKGCVSPH